MDPNPPLVILGRRVATSNPPVPEKTREGRGKKGLFHLVMMVTLQALNFGFILSYKGRISEVRE